MTEDTEGLIYDLSSLREQIRRFIYGLSSPREQVRRRSWMSSSEDSSMASLASGNS
jgi:hypothetical protein